MWLKNFRNRKLQTAVMTLIILLCGILLGSSVRILSCLNEPFYELAEECESAQAVVYPYSVNDAEVQKLAMQLKNMDAVDEAICVRKHYLNEEFSVDGTKLECFSALMEYNDRVFGGIRYVKGNRDTAWNLKENECILPACLCNEYDIKVGDELDVSTVSGDKKYVVRGIFADPYNSSTAYDTAILIKKLPEGMTGNYQIYIYGDKNVSMSDIADDYQSQYHIQLPGQFHSLKDAIDGSVLSMKILGSMLIVIGGIMLLVSCLIIHFMVRNAMITDAKTIAIYKTMGYTTADILYMYLMFYFSIASAATITGLLFSEIFAKREMAQSYQNIGMSADTAMFLPGLVCYLIIVGVILLTVFCVVISTRKVKPVYALNGMNTSNTKKLQREESITWEVSLRLELQCG